MIDFAVVYETHYRDRTFSGCLDENLRSILSCVPADRVWITNSTPGTQELPPRVRSVKPDDSADYLRIVARESGASRLVRVKLLDVPITGKVAEKFLKIGLSPDESVAYADFDDMGFFGSFLEALPVGLIPPSGNGFRMSGYKDRFYYIRAPKKRSYWFDFEDRAGYFDQVLPQRYRIPGSINIEVSSGCMLRCRMCWTGGDRYRPSIVRRPAPLMDQDLYQEILRQIAEAGQETPPILCMSFRGEPLMNKRLPEMIREASRRGLKVLLISNAMLLTPEISRRLLDAGVWEIAFSVNSHDPQLYARIQKRGDFSKVMGNIEEFLKLKEKMGRKDLRVCYRCVLQEENEDQMESMIQHLYTPEIFNISFQYEILRPNFPAGGGKAWKTFCRLPGRVPCWNLWWNCTITTEGNVLPCVTCTNELEGEVMGNVRNEHLYEIWHNDLYQKYRSLHLSGNLDAVPFCRSCDQAEVSNWSNDAYLSDGVEVLTYPAVRALRRT